MLTSLAGPSAEKSWEGEGEKRGDWSVDGFYKTDKLKQQRRHLQTKAFLFTRSALCAERPRSRGGFLRIKLVALLDLGVTTVAEFVVLGDEAFAIVAGGVDRIDLLSSFDLALRENRCPLGVTAERFHRGDREINRVLTRV